MTINQFGASHVTDQNFGNETNAVALDYSTLKLGFRLVNWVGQKPHMVLTAVDVSEISKYLSELPGSPTANYVDVWAVDGGENVRPIEYEKTEIVKAGLSAYTSLVQRRVFHSSPTVYLSRDPEAEMESKNGVGTYGYINSDYRGSLVLQGTEIPAGKLKNDEILVIEGTQTSRRVMFSAKRILSLDNTAYQTAKKAEFTTANPDWKETGVRDSKVEAIGRELGHAKAAFWKMEMVQMLLQGKSLRLNTHFLWDYARTLLSNSVKFENQPKAGAKAMLEQVSANRKERQDYLGRQAGTVVAKVSEAGYQLWGTENDYITVADLAKLPVMTKIEIAPGWDAGGRIASPYWHLGDESDLTQWLNTFCVRAEYALRIVRQ